MPLGRARRRPLPPAAPSALTAEPWPLWSPKRRREWPPREHSRCEDPARPRSWGEGTPARNRDPGCQETYLAEQVGGRPGGAREHGRRLEKPTAPSLIAEGRRLGHSPRGHVQVLLDLSVLRLCTCICVFDVTTSGSVYPQKKEKQPPPLCPPGPASCVGRAFSGLGFPLPRRQTSGRGGGDFTPRPGVSEKHGEASLPRWREPPAP